MQVIETVLSVLLIGCMVLTLTFAAFALACMVYGDLREYRKGR